MFTNIYSDICTVIVYMCARMFACMHMCILYHIDIYRCPHMQRQIHYCVSSAINNSMAMALFRRVNSDSFKSWFLYWEMIMVVAKNA